MLGRKTYTRQEIDQAKAAIGQQLAAYSRLAGAVASDPDAAAALEDFEPLFFSTLTLALDRHFVHRVRAVSGKDGNPLNEVELLADALMGNGGVLQASTVIKLKPDESVLGLDFGEEVQLRADDFRRLADAFLAEIEARFAETDEAG